TIRLDGWQQCRLGYAQIIIGTRSSVLYPFANLGLIIVDESHDQSYKQQDSLRYHASDVALYRGFQLNCPVILGTATPSLESLYLVQQGKLTELTLTQRAGDAKPAIMQLIDARQQAWQNGLAQSLIQAIRQTLDKDEQVLVFLNRRGYAPILLCDACGWQVDCPRCDAHLTVHFQPV
ncbi:primosomal protein N', partial [Salmonella enterica subsp. enterica]|nr:primosomal protein N' [Salmonella enterica subsp. enterica serovar Poona]